MRLFVLVLLAAGTFYPFARRPNLRVFAFGGMIALYAGAGAVLWNGHACHFARASQTEWSLATVAGSPRTITCEPMPDVGNSLLLAASYAAR